MKTLLSIPLLYILILMLCFASCAQQVNFQKSTHVPAAEVEMKIDRDKNGNYTIDLKVKNLAKPQNLTPGRKTYIVWNQGDYGSFNLGQLKLDDKLKGKLKASSVYKPNQIIITAENNPMATQPDNQVVLKSDEINID
ncbi:MAG: hypothetical protein WD048_04085 [Chitinophagales bacterium]